MKKTTAVVSITGVIAAGTITALAVGHAELVVPILGLGTAALGALIGRDHSAKGGSGGVDE